LHQGIAEASVVGLRDGKYGEVVGCFLRAQPGLPKASDIEVQEWVRAKLGKHKAPKWVFWIGDPGVVNDYPKTGSGKHQKHLLRSIGDKLVKKLESPRAKL